jgi:hypothetical protein
VISGHRTLVPNGAPVVLVQRLFVMPAFPTGRAMVKERH